jgi:NADH dehydrogenase/NADH:ubiquinone oxidoreductase subunit G
MCDHGRLSFPYVHENRLHKPKVHGRDATWREARRAALDLLSGSNTVVLVSAWNTVEAMEAVKNFVTSQIPAARIAAYGNPVQKDQVFPGFTISGDKNPNRAGLKQVFGIDLQNENTAASLQSLSSDSTPIGTLLLVHNIPDFVMTPELKAVLDRSENVVLLDFAAGDLLRYGNVAVALPTLTSFEKAGTFVNRDGLAQAFEPVMQPATYGLPEVEILAALVADSRMAAVPNG